MCFFFFSSRRRHTRYWRDWSSDVCSSDLMKDFSSHSSDTRARWRNYYEQEIFNAQLQDTITLNRKGDLWLTPSIRYNRSTILGRSERYDKKKDPQKWKFFSREDKQTDDKVTWQVAIKKQFNEHFTLRATGGTYYRLLNRSEERRVG